jgi:hypothetical protein
MTTYQRLKKENEELKRKLMVVCLYPESIEAITIIHSRKLLANIESAIWAGDSSLPTSLQPTKLGM